MNLWWFSNSLQAQEKKYWFKSYLIGRRQCTTVVGYKSDAHQTRCGLPQGSLLGPVLFLLYINDLLSFSFTSSPMILV